MRIYQGAYLGANGYFKTLSVVIRVGPETQFNRSFQVGSGQFLFFEMQGI